MITEKRYIGIINIENKVIISDLYYKSDKYDTEEMIDNMLPGSYECYAICSEEKDELIVTAIEIISTRTRITPIDYGPEKFTVNINNEQIGIFNFSYYNTKIYNDIDWINIIYDITHGIEKFGLTDYFGFVSSSGYGNGMYTYYISKNEEGKVIAIYIEFISDNDKELI